MPPLTCGACFYAVPDWFGPIQVLHCMEAACLFVVATSAGRKII